MESLYLLIPLSLLFLVLVVGALFWAVHSGQYDDVEREGGRILFDDDLQTVRQPDPASADRRGSAKTGEESGAAAAKETGLDS